MLTDFDIKTWANKRSKEDLCAFVSVCCSLVLPFIRESESLAYDDELQFDLAVIRSILTTATYSKFPSPSLQIAANDTCNLLNSLRTEGNSKKLNRLIRMAFASSNCAASSSDMAAAQSAATTYLVTLGLGLPEALTAAIASEIAGTASLIRNHGRSTSYSEMNFHQSNVSRQLEQAREDLITSWRTTPEFKFWIDWYEGWLARRQTDWELWRRISLISDSTWYSGPSAISREIERIQLELLNERTSAWEPQARSVIKRADAMAAHAQLLAQTIDATLTSIRQQLGNLNKAPDSLEPLERLSEQLSKLQISLVANSAYEEKVKVVSEILREMYATICTLNDRLAASKSWFERHPVATASIASVLSGTIGAIGGAICSGMLGANADAQMTRLHQYTFNTEIHICEVPEKPDFKDTTPTHEAIPQSDAPNTKAPS